MKNVLLKSFLVVWTCILAVGEGKINAQQIVQVGTATTANNMYSPIAYTGTYGKNKHYQILYTAEELNALGVTGASILDSIAFHIQEPTAMPLPNFGIKMKNISAPTISSFDGVGLTQVHLVPSYTPRVESWDWYAFQTPFTWDGYSNLLIDVCFDAISSSNTSSSGRVYFSPSSGQVVYSTVTSECSNYSSKETTTNRPNTKFSFRPAPPCSGAPAKPTLSPGGPFDICASAPIALTAASSTTGSGISYEWEYSTNNGSTWSTIDSLKSISPVFNPSANTQYRVKVTCESSSQSSTSNPVIVNVQSDGLIYRPLPYTQEFESWISRCGNSELPDSNWTAYPLTGDNTWRREDQGATANWTGQVVPSSYPTMENDHSARFHSCSDGIKNGYMSVYLDCSLPGDKEMRFDYISKTGGSPRLDVMLSLDGGQSFELLKTLNSMGVNAEWQKHVIPFVSTSPHTVIKFSAYTFSQWGDYDMGINHLEFLAPCTEAPVAGEVDSTAACKGGGLELSLSGNTWAAGMEYIWQKSTDGIVWENVLGGDVESPTTSIDKETWFRCIVTCVNSNISDTTAPKLIRLNPFYYCYCNSSSTVAVAGLNFGNVKIITSPGGDTLLDNGNPLPATSNLKAREHYSDFTHLPPVDLFVDSAYQLDLTYFTSYGTNVNPQMGRSYTKVYIDYNRNGTFEEDEVVYKGTKPVGVFSTSSEFTVRNNALPGITGMRLITNDVYDSSFTACGQYSYGETEDYLVHIHEKACAGQVDAGAITPSDTAICAEYPIILTNTGYEAVAGPIARVWQKSTDQSNWTDIERSYNADSIEQTITQPTFYRVKTFCLKTNDSSYSAVTTIGLDPLCYCVSYADGGFAGMADSSDVGAFAIDPVFKSPLTGGHLNNSDAVNKYTKHKEVLLLEAGRTYEFTIDHTILRGKHADAKITMFIDYDGNGVFDIPDERVYSDISEATTWHKTGTFTVPSNAVLDKETGLRLIINNNVEPNVPSDEGCGIYTSGETEDFIVKFQEGTGIADRTGLIEGLRIFPNPTTGLTNVQYRGATLKTATLTVQNLIGQVLFERSVEDLSNGSVIHLDLVNFASGVYIIKIDAEGGNATGKVVLQ